MGQATLNTVGRVTTSDAIAADRPCHKCGYSLRGLSFGGKCPECGTPIRRPRGRFADALTEAPLGYLKPLAAGSLVMAACSVGGAIAFAYARGPWRLYGSAWAVALCAAWWLGVWIVTRQRPFTDTTVRDPMLDSRGLRLGVRLSQLAWLIAALGWLVAAYVPVLTAPVLPPLSLAPAVLPPPSPLEVMGRRVALVFHLIGFVSVVPLSVLLSSLADWAAETGLAERFRMSAWGVSAGGVLAVVVTVFAALAGCSTSPIVFGIVAVALGLATVGQALFIASLVQLAYSAIWAISNAHQRIVVEERLARRAERDERRMVDRTAAADQAMRTVRPSPTAPGPANQPSVERPRGGAEPYALEPELPEGDEEAGGRGRRG